MGRNNSKQRKNERRKSAVDRMRKMADSLYRNDHIDSLEYYNIKDEADRLELK